MTQDLAQLIKFPGDNNNLLHLHMYKMCSGSYEELFKILTI